MEGSGVNNPVNNPVRWASVTVRYVFPRRCSRAGGLMTPRPVWRAKDQTSYEHVEWAKQVASSAVWSLYGGQTAARRGAAARALLSLRVNNPIDGLLTRGFNPQSLSGLITPWVIGTLGPGDLDLDLVDVRPLAARVLQLGS